MTAYLGGAAGGIEALLWEEVQDSWGEGGSGNSTAWVAQMVACRHV